MVKKGDNFENLTLDFVKRLFTDMGYTLIKARKQKSGTQNGFDIYVEFLDTSDLLKQIHFECKDYSVDVNWQKLLAKIDELDSSSYNPTAFIAISPRTDFTNIKDNVWKNKEKKVKFPIHFWSPESNVKSFFSIYEDIYEKIYGEKPDKILDRNTILDKIKQTIEYLINKKTVLNCIRKIEINETDQQPNESVEYKTNLDKKLDAILDKNDPDRIAYHKLRCEYKIFLEELEDVDNTLRTQILKWQSDLRLKAFRLTKKFNDLGQNPKQFFHDFFSEAEKSLAVFMKTNNYSCDTEEKLLHGVVFELAAECPLNWVPKNE